MRNLLRLWAAYLVADARYWDANCPESGPIHEEWIAARNAYLA